MRWFIKGAIKHGGKKNGKVSASHFKKYQLELFLIIYKNMRNLVNSDIV